MKNQFLASLVLFICLFFNVHLHAYNEFACLSKFLPQQYDVHPGFRDRFGSAVTISPGSNKDIIYLAISKYNNKSSFLGLRIQESAKYHFNLNEDVEKLDLYYIYLNESDNDFSGYVILGFDPGIDPYRHYPRFYSEIYGGPFANEEILQSTELFLLETIERYNFFNKDHESFLFMQKNTYDQIENSLAENMYYELNYNIKDILEQNKVPFYNGIESTAMSSYITKTVFESDTLSTSPFIVSLLDLNMSFFTKLVENLPQYFAVTGSVLHISALEKDKMLENMNLCYLNNSNKAMGTIMLTPKVDCYINAISDVFKEKYKDVSGDINLKHYAASLYPIYEGSGLNIGDVYQIQNFVYEAVNEASVNAQEKSNDFIQYCSVFGSSAATPYLSFYNEFLKHINIEIIPELPIIFESPDEGLIDSGDLNSTFLVFLMLGTDPFISNDWMFPGDLLELINK